MSIRAETYIRWGCESPYDTMDRDEPYRGRDRARRAVRGVMSNLRGRGSLDSLLDSLDGKIRTESMR